MTCSCKNETPSIPVHLDARELDFAAATGLLTKEEARLIYVGVLNSQGHYLSQGKS